MIKPHESSRKALGKGLGSLLPTRHVIRTDQPDAGLRDEGIAKISIDQIDANPVQPRRVFDAERLGELAQSLKSHGMLQPLVVRPHDGRYQLVAGERRWRAARLAGLSQVPAIVQQIPDERLLEFTLIENIQREDLNPIETATAFDRLSRELHLNHDEIGQRTGKDRTTITNLLRLLQLPRDVQQLVAERRLSASHARCIAGLPTPEQQRELAEKAVAQGWSVRQVERLTRKMSETRETKAVDEVETDPNVKAAVQEMERVLGTKIRIVEKSNQRGRIEIEYYSSDDLDRIYSAIVGSA